MNIMRFLFLSTCIVLALSCFTPPVAYADPECAIDETDRDGDGVCDRLDLCPADPGRTNPGTCGCGTDPAGELDFDDDGRINCRDACAFNPTKVDNAGVCGCDYVAPEPDFDGDSFPDCSEQENNPSADLCPFDPEKRLPGACGCNNEENIALCLDHCSDDVTSWNVLSKVSRSDRNVRVQFRMRPGFDASCLVPEDVETDEEYKVVAHIQSARRGEITVGPRKFTGSESLTVGFNAIRMRKGDRIAFSVLKVEPENGGERESFDEATCVATSSRKVKCSVSN